ncbi:hypothetical protein C5167_010895 [Papaver somniferum]|uniref:Exostosin GT47 domain-containing protein n=1 Tax=Papaver somniferum TaxID=3469 RepID=A0A4Y7K4D7_PAPSO|nr:hypothetical protein C5167_010895 [Papaver somniferum]
MAGKFNPVSSISSQFSLIQRSLLTLSSLTLILFTYISFKSLHFLLHYSFEFNLINPKIKILEVSLIFIILMKFFRLNYAEMEKNFKVYIYPDGDPNTFYQTPRKLTGQFRTEIAELAHLFFIPISCHKMRGKGTSYANMTIIVKNYVDSLILKYPYWNRTLVGADHFFVTCHDVGVRATEGVPLLIKNSIRVVCSPSYDVGFIPHKDVALPQVLQPFALPAGGNDIQNRTTLGFWAGHRNSKIRVVLVRVWENDTELDIKNNRINRSLGPLVYQKKFYRTKFCICPGGSQVNSARITDSIHYGCVPVILSDYYDLPFNDILNWRKFSVILKENDDIPEEQFVALHKNTLLRCRSIFSGIHLLPDMMHFIWSCTNSGCVILSSGLPSVCRHDFVMAGLTKGQFSGGQ